MPVQFLTRFDRDKLTKYPAEIPEDNLIIYFALSDQEKFLAGSKRGFNNKLGIGVLIGTLRYLGYFPDSLDDISENLKPFISEQLSINSVSNKFESYEKRPQTKTDHEQEVIQHLGFQKTSQNDLDVLRKWLCSRALEHDKP